VLQHLRESISKATIQQENCTKPLSVLAELCDIKSQGSTLRPVCVLVSVVNIICVCMHTCGFLIHIRICNTIMLNLKHILYYMYV